MIQPLPLEVAFGTGAHIYAAIHGVVGGVRKYWNPTLNSGAGGWEAFNAGHWAQYAVALAEDGSSGYYVATYPAGIAGVITSETYYNNAAPTMGDTPISPVSYSQGRNANGLGADPVAAANAQAAFASEDTGLAAGVPTASVIPTNLANALANAYAGRAVLFLTGAAAKCAGRIIGYNPTNGVLTLAAPLAAAPAAGDAFVIV